MIAPVVCDTLRFVLNSVQKLQLTSDMHLGSVAVWKEITLHNCNPVSQTTFKYPLKPFCYRNKDN